MIDVKLIRIVTGEEIIAEIVSEGDTAIVVKNGLVVIPSAQGVGFAPWATIINKEKPEITLDKRNLIYIVDLDEEVTKKYNEMFGSKLVTPASKKLIV